jgi:hypothetical protein
MRRLRADASCTGPYGDTTALYVPTLPLGAVIFK